MWKYFCVWEESQQVRLSRLGKNSRASLVFLHSHRGYGRISTSFWMVPKQKMAFGGRRFLVLNAVLRELWVGVNAEETLLLILWSSRSKRNDGFKANDDEERREWKGGSIVPL